MGVNKIYMGTNTKMFKTVNETSYFIDSLQKLTSDISRSELELFVIPSYTTLYKARETIQGASIRLGAQNMCWEERGQFSGEISPLMLKDFDVDIVMIGHSERRHIFGEQDSRLNLKVVTALRHGFTALLCIGETDEQKKNSISDEILRVQLKSGLKNVSPEMTSRLWIAYEPVWAIGVGGKPATADYAEEKHFVIKSCLSDLFGVNAALKIPVLYGGSVNNDNAPKIIQKRYVDGLFIGRSAWDAANFNAIIRAVMPIFNQRKFD